MSRTSVFISIILALVATVAGYALLTPRSATSPHADAPSSLPLLAFTAGDVHTIEIQRQSALPERLVRTDGRWRLQIGPDSWPVADVQMRGFLQVLAELRAVSIVKPAPGAPVTGKTPSSPDSVRLTLMLTNGDTRSLHFESVAVGGRRVAVADDGQPVYIDQPIYEMLTMPGPRGWRETHLFHDVGAEISRIELRMKRGVVESGAGISGTGVSPIVSASNSLSLARLRGRWFLRAPVRAPADPAAVGRLLDQLARLEVTRWIDDRIATGIMDEDDAPSRSAADGSAVNSPTEAASHDAIVIERDRRVLGADGETRVITDRQEIRVGGPADLAAQERLIEVGESRTPAVIAVQAINELSLDPAAYASRAALELTPSQVFVITVSYADPAAAPLALSRTLDGWSASLAADSSVSGDAAASHAAELLAFLTARRADAISITPAPSMTPIARVELHGVLNREPLGQLEVFRTDDGIIIVTDEVFRRYKTSEPPAILTAP